MEASGQPFNFYEGSLVTSAFIVPASKPAVLLSSKSSAATLQHSPPSCSESDDENASINVDYASDFERSEPFSSIPPLTSSNKFLDYPKVGPNKKLLTPPSRPIILSHFTGKTHPLLRDGHEPNQPLQVMNSKTSLYSLKGNFRNPQTRQSGSAPSQMKSTKPKRDKLRLPATIPQPRPMPTSSSIAIRPDVDQKLRLATIIDELKLKLRDRDEEVKTLKIINRRQDIAIRHTDKSVNDLPRLYQQQTDELRALKHFHASCAGKVANAEKSSQEHIEEAVQLREKISKLNAAMRVKFGNASTTLEGGPEKLLEELERLNSDCTAKSEVIVDLTKKLKHQDNTTNMMIREARGKCTKLTKEVEELKVVNNELAEKLEEKTRQIAAMSIYSLGHTNQRTHNEESSRNPHHPRPPSTHEKLNPRHKNNITAQTSAPNLAKLHPQQSVHKPTLTVKPATPSNMQKPKANRDNIILAWNLSQSTVPESKNTTCLSRDELTRRFQLLEDSEESPIGIVARRFLLMHLAVLNRSPADGSPVDDMAQQLPPRASEKPIQVHKPGLSNSQKEVEAGNETKGEADLEFFKPSLELAGDKSKISGAWEEHQAISPKAAGW
ncbi:hypothetical protein BC830DRAFT_1170488 [Chytriomyces sp. MP71]|nr:hypothetical protein BC830DRAFT_1170488 [Chytriomyces sp. MP71]